MKLIKDRIDSVFGRLVKFEHEPLPLIGVDSKPFTDKTEHTKDWDWDRMDEELCIMMAMNPLDKYPKVVSSQPPKLKKGSFEDEVMNDYNGESIKHLDTQQQRKYMHFRHKTVLPWFFILDLKPSRFDDKINDNTPWADISKLTPYTRQCIEQLPFSEIGRVVIYGSWAGSTVPCHRDTLPTDNPEQIINFNPGGYRPVFVYDSLNDKKHYLPQQYKAYSYNTSDYHGVEYLDCFSYTVRVDGKFS
tara:strand:+ start:374 stop:1111 length:738 start_codon:yes stop_codon:yes gene_type:complete